MIRVICQFIFVFLYFSLVLCDHLTGNNSALEVSSFSRGKKPYHWHHHYWAWHALAIAYFIKVKLVIIAFMVGSAFFWGLRYLWSPNCHSQVTHAPAYEHTGHYEHIPYSLDHHPGIYMEHDGAHHHYALEPHPTYTEQEDHSTTDDDTYRQKRNAVAIETNSFTRRKDIQPEHGIGDLVLTFLGLDTISCRRRFICDMELRSRQHPLSRIAFRVVGEGFFSKYINKNQKLGKATSLEDCATVHSDCIYMEKEAPEENYQKLYSKDLNAINLTLDFNESGHNFNSVLKSER